MNIARAASGVPGADAALVQTVREELGRIVVALTRSFGSLDVAEEATAAAVEEALKGWRLTGVPPQPGAWLMTAARHNAIDITRRSRRYRDALSRAPVPAPHLADSGEVDDRLPLLFGCCHPSLPAEAQLALTLRAVVGLTTEQIARATVEPVSTVGQRISRAKRKIGVAGIPLEIPEGKHRANRLDLVLTVISVMYDSAHLRPESTAGADRDLAEDAMWLAHTVVSSLSLEPEAHGLCALLFFHHAREAARSRDGDLVPLSRQDRQMWDADLIRAGEDALLRAARLRRPGRWQLQAAIAACHCDAREYSATDWPQILTLYNMLLRYDSSPIVRLNRAVALAEVGRLDDALAELRALRTRLDRFHLWHAVHGDVLRRSGQCQEADNATRRAKELTRNHAEQRLLAARLSR